MFFDVEWSEKGQDRFRKVFHAADLPVLWKAVRYMNMERGYRKLPTMGQIHITILNHYDGEYSPIVGSYVKDLQQDKYLAGTISHM